VPRGALAASAYGTVPVVAAMAALYTTVDCVAGELAGARDWRTSAAGGAAAGVLASAAKGGPAGNAVTAALVFSAVAAAAGLFAKMEPTVEKLPGVRERAGDSAVGRIASAVAGSGSTAARLR